METNTYKFDIPQHQKSIIKVIGVGGGGSNAVNHMYNLGIKDVEFVVCNTDSQALNSSPVPNKLQIGLNLTGGLGAGANPEQGKSAAMESKEEIRALMEDNTKMVFITAGMGGGTGTGAAPVIAQIAKDMGILTVGIVTLPFGFEGKKKLVLAEVGIKEMQQCCDTVLVILNDKLREIYGNVPISEAFAEADNVLLTAAKGIAEIITVPGYVNVDFEDVKTVMLGAGAAVMGSSTVNGENRARKAAEEAISSPLLNNQNIHGAQKILLSIISGEQAELQMDELSEITEFIQEMSGDEAEMIFGHGIDAGLENNIRVTVIATGFDETNVKQDLDPEKKVYDLESNKQISLFEASKKEVTEDQPREIELLMDQKDEPESEDKVEEEETSVFDKGYFFEMDHEEEEDTEKEPKEEMVTDEASGLESEFDEIEGKEDEVIDEDGMLELSQKKEILQQQAKERVERLRGLSGSDIDMDEFKEKLDVPAYLRKKVKLERTPLSTEHNVSRYNLTDDNQIMGNNKFLHDNVD